MTSHAFRYDRRFSPLLRLWGVDVAKASVVVDDGELAVLFGPWGLRTSLGNIESAQQSGPFKWFRSVGIRLSLADKGITFGTAADRGVCLVLRSPASATFRGRLLKLRHPNVTVTVEDPHALVAAVSAA